MNFGKYYLLFRKLVFAKPRRLLLITSCFVLLVISLWPELPAIPLTSFQGWNIKGDANAQVPLFAFPEQYRQLRKSVVESSRGVLFRTWTPTGIVPIEVVSPQFYPTRYMSVAITGSNRTPEGQVHAFIQCESSGSVLEIFRGSVNNHVTEAIVVPPVDWCHGSARMKFKSYEKGSYVGVGAVFEISYLSYVKSSFLGRVPYFLTALAIFSLVMFAGASLVVRLGWHGDPLPIAFTSLGAASLGVFYLASGVLVSDIPAGWHWVSIALVAIATTFSIVWSGREARTQAARALYPYAKVWAFASLIYFTLLSLGANGVGHWEPNYRFWPATWSSDNELPWMFAEAIRHGWDLKGLFGGGWLPTDRPPLMAGAHLLLTDVFGWLQSGNDGTYLRGQAYNAAAVVLNALWVPAILWLLTRLQRGINAHGKTAILVFVGCLPFVLFNTVYGWPKAFGAAFALMAFGMAWLSREPLEAASRHSTIMLFFILGAFSMLAHASVALFLAPLGLLFLWWTLRRNTRSVLIGFGIALVLLASWGLYKLLVLPSYDPVTKFALTGDYGFGHPEWSLWQMLAHRYGSLDFWHWLAIKKTMLLQAFIPVHHSIAQIGLNADSGAGVVDKLRAWDFMLLSKGNLAVPLLVLISTWAAISAFTTRREVALNKAAPFFALIGVSLVAWLLLVTGFLAPAVIHHWPQAALFGLALGGAVVLYARSPLIFRASLLLVFVYTGVVWVVSPLHGALTIDVGAAVMLVILLGWAFLAKLSPTPVNSSSQDRLVEYSGFSLSRILAALKDSQKIQRVGNAAIWQLALQLIVIGALLFSAYITIRYIQQPLADAHAFRQTQTALTSYWMLQEGWALAYQTPVAGYPWSIPFEFPIYQAAVAATAALTGFDLGAVGRFISFLFLVACAWPAFAISRRLNLPNTVPWVFCALLWTSPLNVYWGRTFMIETAALFFSLACIPYAIDFIRRVGGWRSVSLFWLFATAAVLQKATTGGPVLLFLALSAAFLQVRVKGFGFQALQRLIVPAVIISIPLVIGLAWAHYADIVKTANPFGSQLTSKALTTWNFGSLAQKLDFETWRLVIWERSLVWNAGGWVGLMLLVLPWFGGPEHRRFAWLSLAAVALFLLPVLIFTNLHFVHEYYQVACVAFLLGALAIVIGAWLKTVTGTMMIVPIVTIVIILSNLAHFNSSYGIVAARALDELDPRSVQTYKVGRYLREVTRPETGLVVFGSGYSSEIAFQAQRKTMAVPPWFTEYKELWESPQNYLGDLELAAVVICPAYDVFPNIKGFPDLVDLKTRMEKEPEWVHRTVHGCELLLSPQALVAR